MQHLGTGSSYHHVPEAQRRNPGFCGFHGKWYVAPLRPHVPVLTQSLVPGCENRVRERERDVALDRDESYHEHRTCEMEEEREVVHIRENARIVLHGLDPTPKGPVSGRFSRHFRKEVALDLCRDAHETYLNVGMVPNAHQITECSVQIFALQQVVEEIQHMTWTCFPRRPMRRRMPPR